MSSDEGTSVDAPMAAASGQKSSLTSKLLTDPGMMQAFGGHLNSLVGEKSSYIDSMPAVMKGRIRALKNLQVDYFKMESKFYEEVQALERKFSQLHRPIDVRRRDIITGAYEPTDQETEVTFEDSEDEGDAMNGDEDDVQTGATITDCDENGDPIASEEAAAEVEKEKYDDSTAGIPEFWLQALRNVEVIADMIEPTDEPLLRCLTDIEIVHSSEPLGFDLVFHFSPNKYISNETLVKHYDMKIEVDEEEPFAFEGPQITGCNGCEVNWQKGFNLTVKTIKKKQKGKGKGQPGKTVTKQVPATTFFSFFSPPSAPEDDEEELTEDQEEAVGVLANDYEVASFIRDTLVRKAVLVFTGEEDNGEGGGSPFFDFGGEDDEGDEEGGMMAQRLAAAASGGAGGKQECAQQ